MLRQTQGNRLRAWTPGGWTPLNLGSSLYAWWTADRADLITLSGASIASWRDVVAGYDAVQVLGTSQPSYSATSFNGAPAATFDGIADELTCTDVAMILALPDGAEPGEIWGIFQQDALAADTTLRAVVGYGGILNAARIQRRNVDAGVNRLRTTTGTGAANVNNDNVSVNLSSRHVGRSIFTATTISTQVDAGAVSTPNAAVSATATSRLRIGANSTAVAGNFWQGQIRDVLVTAPLTVAQAALLNAWALPRRML